MGLSSDLLALGPALEPEEAQWGDPDVPTAWLCPRLRTTYSPRASWAEWRKADRLHPVDGLVQAPNSRYASPAHLRRGRNATPTRHAHAAPAAGGRRKRQRGVVLRPAGRAELTAAAGVRGRFFVSIHFSNAIAAQYLQNSAGTAAVPCSKSAVLELPTDHHHHHQ